LEEEAALLAGRAELCDRPVDGGWKRHWEGRDDDKFVAPERVQIKKARNEANLGEI
jgi:hypothetical protein